MKRSIWVTIVLLILLALPASSVAQDAAEDDGVIFRANGDITIGSEDVISFVAIAEGEVTVEGTVTDTLMVFSGSAIVNGQVEGDIILFSGDVSLGESAEVNNVTIFQGTLEQADGATIAGEVTEEGDLAGLGWGAFVFSVMMWIGLFIVLLVAAVLFAWLGRRQLTAAANVARRRIGPALLAALAIIVGLPFLAILSFISVIGMPLGVTIFVVVLPALWLIGYLVMGGLVGQWLLGMMETQNLILAVVVGVVLFQIIGLIPGIGPFVMFLVGLYGAGAFVYWLFAGARSPSAGAEPSEESAVA